MYDYCPRCLNVGTIKGCLICLRKKPKVHKKSGNWKTEQERGDDLLAKIRELESQATSEQFYEDRGEYIRLIKEIKMLTNRLYNP